MRKHLSWLVPLCVFGPILLLAAIGVLHDHYGMFGGEVTEKGQITGTVIMVVAPQPRIGSTTYTSVRMTVTASTVSLVPKNSEQIILTYDDEVVNTLMKGDEITLACKFKKSQGLGVCSYVSSKLLNHSN